MSSEDVEFLREQGEDPVKTCFGFVEWMQQLSSVRVSAGVGTAVPISFSQFVFKEANDLSAFIVQKRKSTSAGLWNTPVCSVSASFELVPLQSKRLLMVA